MQISNRLVSALRYTLLSGTILVAGCSSMEVRDYADEQPELILEDYFRGELYAWGMFQDRSGKVRKRFNVRIEGTVTDGQLQLAEWFCNADGTREQRTWLIRGTGNGRYVGTADDVVGEAFGERAGNALHWTYRLALPVNDRIVEVTFDDWMFLQSPDVLINRAVMKKFGIRLGEVTLMFNRQAPKQPYDLACHESPEISS